MTIEGELFKPHLRVDPYFFFFSEFTDYSWTSVATHCLSMGSNVEEVWLS